MSAQATIHPSWKLPVWLVLAAGLLIFGALRLPIEQELAERHRAAFFHGAKLDISLRERIGQGAFIAALSGFRSLVADLLYIEAHTAWERTQWGRMAYLFENITTLQPRNLMFWDMASWHMAWNASVAAYDDPSQPREAIRRRNQRSYFELGRQFLERGIRNNPDRYLLHERMAILLRDKFEDHCAAADYFDKAASFHNAPPYTKRFAAYELAKCPGREREAYERLRQLWLDHPDERKPTMRTLLTQLQESLEIPPEQRVYITEQDGL